MWILNALLVHILFLGSIFVIYFVSPVLKGLQPQNDVPLEPPAQRLVLIVADGLRAESFFRNNCGDIPYLRTLLPSGIVGVSRTHVPTESRPGHIALIAGMYEDPSAVTRGWKENPIDFDTVFNRSSRTFAWGAHDVLHIFSRLSGAEQRFFFDVYDKELDFSGRHKTYAFDDWVFERVQVMLKRKAPELRGERKLVFFLHLLGLDTAGHVHKPGSELFLENLHHTERGIFEIHKQFEETFPDGRTAYIVTADHGMTNSGSHGAGDPLETDTPFFLWGSGVARSPAPATGNSFKVADDRTLPLHALEQAQLTPLMSALLGVPPPMNNFGLLPVAFLNASDEYKALAAHSNALQLLEQFKQLIVQHERGLLSPILRSFQKLNAHSAAEYERAHAALLAAHNFTAALDSSYTLMSVALGGIDYYQRYYQHGLLLSTAIAFIGWLYYLLQLITQKTPVPSRSRTAASWFQSRTLNAISGVVIVALLLQRVPLLTSVYFVAPLAVWALALRQRQFVLPKLRAGMVVEVLLLLCCVEILVFTFFERKLIVLAFLIFTMASNWPYFKRGTLSFYIWLASLVALVCVSLLLPSAMGYENIQLHFLGIATIIIRPFVVKSRIALKRRLLASAALGNSLLCAYQHTNQIGIHFASQLISWCFLCYVFASICLHRAIDLKQRVEFIFFHLTALYTTFCTSHESLFIMLLASELLLVASLQQQAAPHHKLGAPQLHSTSLIELRTSFRIAFSILLYTLFSFFGVGNMASISSFDPNVMRCYLTTFAPFVIMALVVLKLLLPLILIVAIVFGIGTAFTRLHERQIFLCLLLLCDLMSLNFLFLVRNQGSWLEIGSSISHFVIMCVCTLVLVLLTQFVKWTLWLGGVSPKFVNQN